MNRRLGDSAKPRWEVLWCRGVRYVVDMVDGFRFLVGG